MGTVQSNQKSFPVEIKKTKQVKYQEQKYYRNIKGYLTVIWKDKKTRKPVIAVSGNFIKKEVDAQQNTVKLSRSPRLFVYITSQ